MAAGVEAAQKPAPGAPAAPASAPAARPPAAPAAVASAPAPIRGPRPRIPRYASVTDYPMATLVAVITWLESDGLLRTEEEVIEEAIGELGFTRHGARIDAALRQAVTISRSRRAS